MNNRVQKTNVLDFPRIERINLADCLQKLKAIRDPNVDLYTTIAKYVLLKKDFTEEECLKIAYQISSRTKV